MSQTVNCNTIIIIILSIWRIAYVYMYACNLHVYIIINVFMYGLKIKFDILKIQ